MPQFSFGLPVGAVCQFAFYVSDIPAAMHEYTKQLDVGPWFYMERVTIKNRYRGQPSVFNGSVAVGYAGPMQIELIRQSDTSPSVFMKAIDTKGQLPFFIEVVEVNDVVERVYTALHRTSMNWDGKDPVRRFDSIGDLVATAGN